MANQILTVSDITRESLRILKNNLAFASKINHDYEPRFAKDGLKIGSTLNIRRPTRWTVSTGAPLQIQDSTETSVPLTILPQRHIGVAFTSNDLTLSLDDFSKRILAPQVPALANKLDIDCLTVAKNTLYNAVGTVGVTPASSTVLLAAGVKLDNEACPRDGMRNMAIDPAAQAALVDAFKGFFNRQETIGNQFLSGELKDVYGFNIGVDQNIIRHTIGALGGTPLINGASQSGTSLVTDGWTASAATRLKQGDVFTIDGVYAVNPQNRQSTGQLRQFVCTADGVSDGSGNMTISIYPAINPPIGGAYTQYQTVDSYPADNAAITVMGTASATSVENIACHRDALTLACIELERVGGTEKCEVVTDKETGLSLRMIMDYDVINDRKIHRMDMMYGIAAPYPELGCRIRG